MRKSDRTEQIEQDATSLRRCRLVCALLRREGILAHNPHVLMSLADSLLRSLTRYPSR
jgi:hypothetical protein